MSSCTSPRAAYSSDFFDYERATHLGQNVVMRLIDQEKNRLSTKRYLECGGLSSVVRHTKEGGQTPLWLFANCGHNVACAVRFAKIDIVPLAFA